MATSASTNFATTRDDIIKRVYRILGDVAPDETPTTVQYTVAAEALNHVTKRFQVDGMQLWKRSTSSVTPIVDTGSYAITVGPLRILQLWHRNTSTDVDTPMLLITKQEYDMYSNKVTSGTPNLGFYNPPGAAVTATDTAGTLYILPTPDATFVASYLIYYTSINPVFDFDSSTDNPDYPTYWYNAIVWGLAADMCFESGLPLAERSMILKKAEYEHNLAMSGDYEEGSIYFQPAPR